MSPQKRNPLDEEIGRLYAVPLEEFIGERNALAARLKKEGDAAGSAEVKALPKPTPSAWAVNQLFQSERERMDELLAAGEQARSALHEAITSGGAESLRGAIQESRRLIEDLRQRALEFLAAGGRPASAIMGDRIGTNLQSLTFTPAAAEAARRGWLETDLDPPGFEVLAGLQIAAGGAHPAPRPVKQAPPIRPRPAPVPVKAEKEKKTPEPAHREREKAKAPSKQEREEARLRDWREREEARQWAQQEREEAKLRERLEAAEEEADRTAAEARGLQEEAEKAARAAAEARRTAEKAQDRADKASEALTRAREALAEVQKGAKILSHPGAQGRGKG